MHENPVMSDAALDAGEGLLSSPQQAETLRSQVISLQALADSLRAEVSGLTAQLASGLEKQTQDAGKAWFDERRSVINHRKQMGLCSAIAIENIFDIVSEDQPSIQF